MDAVVDASLAWPLLVAAAVNPGQTRAAPQPPWSTASSPEERSLSL